METVDKVEELNDKIVELSQQKQDIDVEIKRLENEIKKIEDTEFSELKKEAREKLKGHYAIIPFCGSGFSLWYVTDILEDTRYGGSYVDIFGYDYLFRKFNKDFKSLDLIFAPDKVHGITKEELNVSLVIDDNIAIQFIDIIKRALSNNANNGLIHAYKIIYDYYKLETGKTIEKATKETLNTYYDGIGE